MTERTVLQDQRCGAAPASLFESPAVRAVGVVTTDGCGNWFVDGERCVCSLGGHEGMARARATAKKYAAASPEERALMERSWNEESVAPMAPSPDRRAILVHTNDDRLAAFWDEAEAGFEQAQDGPTHLIIGRHVSDDRLQRLASKYEHSFDRLRAFRDSIEEMAVPN